MKNNYYENLKNISNQDLIEIILKQDSYDNEAVKVANEIIKERDISNSEINAVELKFSNIEKKENDKKNKILTYKNKLNNFLKPIFSNGENISPKKWLNSFLFLVGIQFLWYFIDFMTSLESFYEPLMIFYDIFIFTYIILVVYLLLKKKKMGLDIVIF